MNARLDPLDREDELAACIRHWPGMDYDRWWAMSEIARAFHLSHYRLQRMRESHVAKVQEQVAKEWKGRGDEEGGGGAVENFLGGFM